MKRNIYENKRHGIYSGTDKVDPVKPVSPLSPIPNKYPPRRNEQQPVKRNTDEKPAKSFKDMLEEEMEKNKNNANQSWITDPSGNRITDESARDRVMRNKSEMKDINRRMSGRSKADNFRDSVRLRDLQNENDYFDELGIKSGYDRNEQTLKSIFSSAEDTQDNPQEQMVGTIKSTLVSVSDYMRKLIKTFTDTYKAGIEYSYNTNRSPHFDVIKIYYNDGTALELSDLDKGICANVSLWLYDIGWKTEYEHNWKSFIQVDFEDIYLTQNINEDMNAIQDAMNNLLIKNPDFENRFIKNKSIVETEYNHRLSDDSKTIDSSRRNNMKKAIKSAYYTGSDIDEFENSSPDLNIRFQEPLLYNYEGNELFNWKGWNDYVRYLAQDKVNWYNAEELYLVNGENDFRELAHSESFDHDFGHVFWFYDNGLSDVAEELGTKVPSSTQPFSIKNGFAFNLIPAEENDFDTENPYWIDDLQAELPGCFMAAINPSLGNRFDVVVVPETYNTATAEITSGRNNEMRKMKIIKSSKEPTVLSQSERVGLNTILGFICGYYRPDEDDARYLKVKEYLSPEEIEQLNDIVSYVLEDDEYIPRVTSEMLENDIPLLTKVYNIINENDLFKKSDGDYDWDGMNAFESLCIKSNRRNDMKNKAIKSGYDDLNLNADELSLFAINDGNLYRRMTTQVIKNLNNKIKRGDYDEKLALKAWMYVADEAARRYDREMGSGRGSLTLFPKNVREEAAKKIQDHYAEHLDNWNLGKVQSARKRPVKSSVYYISYYGGGTDNGYVGYDGEPCISIDMAMTFDSKEEAEEKKRELQDVWKSELRVESIDSDEQITSSRNMEAVAVAENIPGVQKTYDWGSEIRVYLENGTDYNAAEKLLTQIMDTLENEYDNYDFSGNIEYHGGKYIIVLEPELPGMISIFPKDRKGSDDLARKGLNNSRKAIKSGRYIKSGTSNFVSNDGDFPLCVYIAENYIYDEETDTETEERDYDADQWEYEDAIDNAESLADEMGITLFKKSYRRSLEVGDGYYDMPYAVGITSGYYDGIQIQIEDNGNFDPEYVARDNYDYENDDYFDDLPQEEQDRIVNELEEKLIREQEEKISAYLEKLRGYGWIWLTVTARFSNGETMYQKVDSSRKPIIKTGSLG